MRHALPIRIDGENDLFAMKFADTYDAAHGDATVLGVLERLFLVSPCGDLADFQRSRGACDLILRRTMNAALRVLHPRARGGLSAEADARGNSCVRGYAVGDGRADDARNFA